MIAKILRPLIFVVIVVAAILVGVFMMTKRDNVDLDFAAITGAAPKLDARIEHIPTVAIATPVAWGNAKPRRAACLCCCIRWTSGHKPCISAPRLISCWRAR